MDEEKCEKQAEKKAKAKKKEERVVTRGIDDWEEFAKTLKATAEKNAEESKKTWKRHGYYFGVAREIGPRMRREVRRSNVRVHQQHLETARGGAVLQRNLRRADGQRVGRDGEEDRDGDVQEAWSVREDTE